MPDLVHGLLDRLADHQTDVADADGSNLRELLSRRQREEDDDLFARRHPIVLAAHDLAYAIAQAVKEHRFGVIEAARAIEELYGFFDGIRSTFSVEGEVADLYRLVQTAVTDNETTIFLSLLDRNAWRGRTDWRANIERWWPDRMQLAEYADVQCVTLLVLSEQPWNKVDRQQLDELTQNMMTIASLPVFAPRPHRRWPHETFPKLP